MEEANIKVVTNKQFRVNARDFLRGAVVAAFSGPINMLIYALSQPQFEISWKAFLKGVLAGFLGYVLKNFFMPSNTTVQIKPAAKTNVEGEVSMGSNISIDMVKGQKPVVTTTPM